MAAQLGDSLVGITIMTGFATMIVFILLNSIISVFANRLKVHLTISAVAVILLALLMLFLFGISDPGEFLEMILSILLLAIYLGIALIPSYVYYNHWNSYAVLLIGPIALIPFTWLIALQFLNFIR